jgi:hypothetical protein
MFVWPLFWIKIARISFLKFLSDIETQFLAAFKKAWHEIFVKKPCGFYKLTIQILQAYICSLGNY